MVISKTHPFADLMDRRIPIEWTFKPLDFSLRQISEFTCKFFSKAGDISPSLFGSTVPHAFAGGPIPNDLDMEVELPESVTADNIKYWLTGLVNQPVPNDLIRPIPKKKGWVINLNPAAQIIFKFPCQRLHGLSVLDGLKMSTKTGLLSMYVGDLRITDPTEFDQLMQKIKRRDIENGVTQDIRAQGRFFRILHYIGHGAKLSEQDLLLDDFFRDTQPFDLHQQYVKHLQNHFPTETGKLVDFLNFLTLIKDQPKRCRQVSEIVWNERNRLQLMSFANLAYCISFAPHLTLYLLQFIRGALLHDLVTKNGSSSVRAWHLPFLQGEVRPFFWIKCHNTCRYLAMDSPGKEQSPDRMVMEFFSAWEYLDTELPKRGFHFHDFFDTFKSLGVQLPTNQNAVIKAFASISAKSHLQRLNEHFSSDRLFQKVDLFRSSLYSPWMSREMQLYVQDKLKRAPVIEFCLLRQNALLRSNQWIAAKKCSSKMIHYLNTQGHFLSFINVCLNQTRFYSNALKAIDNVRAISPEMTTKLCCVLKETHSKLAKASSVFRQRWVKAAPQLRDAEVNQKYLDFLSSGKFFKEDPLTILLQLQQQMKHSRKEAFRLLQKLQTRKQEISMLSQEKKELFNGTVLKLLPAPDGAWVPFIEKLMAFFNKCQLFNDREKEQIYQIQAQNAALVGPSQQASVLLDWLDFRQSAFGSAFALPIQPIMAAMQRLNSFPDEAQQPYWSLLQDMRAQKFDEQMRILQEITPFFANEEEWYMGMRLIHFLQNPDQYQEQVNRRLQHIYQSRVLSPAPKRKKKVPKAREPNKYVSAMLGNVELNAAFLFDLFKKLLSQHATPKIDECLAIAERNLESKSLSAFKGEIRAAIQSERSYPDPDQIGEFIHQTAELLPIYSKFFPKKICYRIEALIGRFEKATMRFPSAFSSLLIKARECGLKSSCRPAQWYHFHTTAVRHCVETISWKEQPIEEILEHLQEANQTVHTPDLLQRKDMIQVHRGFALSFLKLALRDFKSSSNWLKFNSYICTHFIPYLQNDKYRSDGLGAQCVQDLLIALSGIPAIFKILSNLVLLKGTRLDFFKELVNFPSELPKILVAYGHEKILKRLKPALSTWLLGHVIDIMASYSEKDLDTLTNMQRFTLHRGLSNEFSYLLMFLQEGGTSPRPGVRYVSTEQCERFLRSHGDLMKWETYCDRISWQGEPLPSADQLETFFFTIFTPSTAN